MQGNERVLELLNELLTLEITAVNQYFAHSKMIENWGFPRLAEMIRKQSFEEMKDAEEIIERVLFLGGVPNLQRLGTVSIGETPGEQLRLMLETEMAVLDLLVRAVAACEEMGDTASREFFAAHIPAEEKHIDLLETQLEVIDRLGEEAYLAQQIRD